jgi:hypothetical protein
MAEFGDKIVRAAAVLSAPTTALTTNGGYPLMADETLARSPKCKDCGALKSKKGLYCKACGYKHRTRPSGLTYKITSPNRGWFKKGSQLNLGRKLSAETRAKISAVQMGQRKSPATEFKAGMESTLWKGDSVGYGGLHAWVRAQLGPARGRSCSQCSSNNGVGWANRSHQYRRDIEDWLLLCAKCHAIYDSGNGRGAAVRKYGQYWK